MRYKLCNTCYKLCNAYYKLCNKNIIYGRKKFLVEKKKYLGGSKISLRDIYVASRFDVLRAAALEFLARALYAPSILPRACVGGTP